MKAYLYIKKDKLPLLQSIEETKRLIADSISESFHCPVSTEDVSIRLGKFLVPQVVAQLILDTNSASSSIQTKDCIDHLRNMLYDFLPINTDENIKLAIKPRYNPLGEELDESAINKGVTKMNPTPTDNSISSELDYHNRAKMYVPVDPAYSFDRVILPEDVLEKIESAINILRYEQKVFNEWGLYEIQPHPSSALSFFGPSGTGKTMAAEAIAQKLGKKILKVSYADVESKYHGEGPKMVKAIFLAAEKEDAVLFFDEADSLLSKRLTNVSQGSEQAINSMRSQLLICLEEFRGIVIFATNLVINYDHAFLTRLISVEFKFPDAQTRKKIWDVHTKSSVNKKLNIPLAEDVDTTALAEKYEFAGREIRNAVISACVMAAMQEREIVTQNDLITACDKIVIEKESLAKANDHTVSDKTKEVIKQAIIEKIKSSE